MTGRARLGTRVKLSVPAITGESGCRLWLPGPVTDRFGTARQTPTVTSPNAVGHIRLTTTRNKLIMSDAKVVGL